MCACMFGFCFSFDLIAHCVWLGEYDKTDLYSWESHVERGYLRLVVLSHSNFCIFYREGSCNESVSTVLFLSNTCSCSRASDYLLVPRG